MNFNDVVKEQLYNNFDNHEKLVVFGVDGMGNEFKHTGYISQSFDCEALIADDNLVLNVPKKDNGTIIDGSSFVQNKYLIDVKNGENPEHYKNSNFIFQILNGKGQIVFINTDKKPILNVCKINANNLNKNVEATRESLKDRTL